MFEVLPDLSKCLNEENVLVLCTYPAKDHNLELFQGSGTYNFTTQWALQNINCYEDWRKIIEYQDCKADYGFYSFRKSFIVKIFVLQLFLAHVFLLIKFSVLLY